MSATSNNPYVMALEEEMAQMTGAMHRRAFASSTGSVAWRREAPNVEGFWWLGWSSTTNYRGLRHEWHTAREYFTRQQIRDCKFPEQGWYAPAVGAHETEPPAMPQNSVLNKPDSDK